jgi:hypothetical protein
MTIRAAAVVLLAGLALAACGEDDPAASPAAGGDSGDGATQQERRDAAVAFAECMRENGVDMPDPQFDENGGMQLRMPPGNDEEAVEAAQEECQEHLRSVRGGAAPSEAQQAEMRERALAFAECMRENGVDFPDPQFEEGGGVKLGGPGIDPEDPDFQDAQEACRDELPNGGPGGGTP